LIKLKRGIHGTGGRFMEEGRRRVMKQLPMEGEGTNILQKLESLSLWEKKGSSVEGRPYKKDDLSRKG